MAPRIAARPICEAALASLKAPLRPVPVPAGPTDVSEEREASAQRRILLYGNRRTTGVGVRVKVAASPNAAASMRRASRVTCEVIAGSSFVYNRH